MKTRILACLMFCILHSITSMASDTIPKVYKYILDYDVPESPAFSILGVNPNEVMRGSAAKPIAVHLANQFIGGDKVENGVALDFNPYFTLLNGGIKNFSEYRKNYLKRLLTNMQWSAATTTLDEFPNDMIYGLGARLTLIDSKDILLDEQLRKEIDKFLIPEEVPDFSETDNPDSNGPTVKDERLPELYKRVRDSIRLRKGGSLSVGWAMAGQIRSATLRSDSFNVLKNQIWLSGQYTLTGGFDLLGTLIKRFENSDDLDDETWIGFGVRFNRRKSMFSGELVYKQVGDKGSWDGGFNVGFNLLPKILMVVHLATEEDTASKDGGKKAVIRTGIRWNMSEEN